MVDNRYSLQIKVDVEKFAKDMKVTWLNTYAFDYSTYSRINFNYKLDTPHNEILVKYSDLDPNNYEV